MPKVKIIRIYNSLRDNQENSLTDKESREEKIINSFLSEVNLVKMFVDVSRNTNLSPDIELVRYTIVYEDKKSKE